MTTSEMTVKLVIPDVQFLRFCLRVLGRANYFGALSFKDAQYLAFVLVNVWPWYIK